MVAVRALTGARWDAVIQIPLLRFVSVSQWADSHKMSEYLQGDYVYCYKVCKTDIAVPIPDEGYIRRRLVEVLTYCKQNGNKLELLMKAQRFPLGRNCA